MKFKVVYTDDSLLVLDKPPGLVVTSSETKKEPALEDILRIDLGVSADRSGIVHRLDKDTSGLLLVAKDNQMLLSLQSQFKSREVKKEYLALVHGFVEKGGRIEAAIGRNPLNREKFTVVTSGRSSSRPPRWPNGLLGGGREAVTEYEPLGKFKIQSSKFKIIFEDFNKIQLRKLEKMNYGEFTLLSCKPLTGRTHQIRVHLKYVGHPVVGDGKYAGRKMARLDARWCPRQFLHAARLEFRHPKTGKWVSFESNLPEDLEQALEMLEVKSKK